MDAARESEAPLVTLAVPVRNGAEMLRGALDSMVAQDYSNIEIVVSDNASDDDTPRILAEYCARYPNIRVLRQDTPVPAFDNFLRLLDEARGQYFAWCAHDDIRSNDFISGLLGAFDKPGTVLAFCDLYTWGGGEEARLKEDYDFENSGLPKWRRLRKAAHMQCYHIYGLWRLSALRAISYYYSHWWPDLPIMCATAANGFFRYVPGPKFLYYEVYKTDEDRALYQDYRHASSKFASLMALLRAVLITVGRSAGVIPSLLATTFTAERYLRQFPSFIFKRLSR